MSTTTNWSSCSEAIAFLVNEAKAADMADRRSEDRYPYFRPVNIIVDQSERRNYSVFSRDISSTGMGLLHNMPLEPGQATLRVDNDLSPPVIMPCEIKWCRCAGEGWYVSGVSFVETT